MKFLLLCEGPGDDEDLHAITWNVLRSVHGWLDGQDRDGGVHGWVESGPHEVDATRKCFFFKWGHINLLCDQHGVPPVQRLGRGLGYRLAKRALNLLLAMPDVDLVAGLRVVMVHDTDGTPGWSESLAVARDEWLADHHHAGRAEDIDVAVGAAHPEHEAWVIALFEPRDGVERARLEDVRRALGVDPTRCPEALTSGRETGPKDAKRTLDALVGDDFERRRGIAQDASIETMLRRGRTCGLSAFVLELVERAATAYGAVTPQALEGYREVVRTGD